MAATMAVVYPSPLRSKIRIKFYIRRQHSRLSELADSSNKLFYKFLLS